MSSNSPTGHGPSKSALPGGERPLPARPSLEFERKRAKKLLREIRESQADAKLTDAQFAIAREYGFTSWPRLVEYFERLARHEHSPWSPTWYPLTHFDRLVEQKLKAHAERGLVTARSLSAFVPRFYGRSIGEVFEAQITIDDARLAVARENRLPSWDALVEFANASRNGGPTWDYYETPMSHAFDAIVKSDLATLAEIVTAHPDIAKPRNRLEAFPGNLIHSALLTEWKVKTPEARRVTDFLAANGADLATWLNQMLLGWPGGRLNHPSGGGTMPEFYQFLIDRGADPAWVAPNGYGVLEHNIARGVHPDALALIAKHIAVPKAFWIAAGLGDVESVKRYYDRAGKLTPAARRNRPDLTALSPSFALQLGDDDIDVAWEAFCVAFLSERYEVLDVLLDRGFPIDYAPLGRTFLWFSINGRMVPRVEYLVRRGATADITGSTDEQKDQWLFDADPTHEDARRIYEICGGKNPEAVLRRFEQRAPKDPVIAERVTETLAAARADAASMGQREVDPFNVFVALIAEPHGFSTSILHRAGVDGRKLRERLGDRMERSSHKSPAPDLPNSAATTTLLAQAIEQAKRSGQGYMNTLYLYAVLFQEDSGPVADLIASCGGDIAKARANVAETLH